MIIVVSDLLWLGAWMVGKHKAEHPETVTALKEAKRLIEVRGLDVQFVHHSGHQMDSSDCSTHEPTPSAIPLPSTAIH